MNLRSSQYCNCATGKSRPCTRAPLDGDDVLRIPLLMAPRRQRAASAGMEIAAIPRAPLWSAVLSSLRNPAEEQCWISHVLLQSQLNHDTVERQNACSTASCFLLSRCRVLLKSERAKSCTGVRVSPLLDLMTLHLCSCQLCDWTLQTYWRIFLQVGPCQLQASKPHLHAGT